MFIELEVLSVDGFNVTFRIMNQSDRNFEDFNASNGYSIRSVDMPEGRGSILYVRGSTHRQDNFELTVSKPTFSKYVEAIEEFNAREF